MQKVILCLGGLTLLAVDVLHGFTFECPASCNYSPCSCVFDTDLNCGANTCHSNGCDQCLDGYWKQSYSHKCVQCQESTGDGCLHCTDFIGCQQCDTANGYVRLQDTSCGRTLYYCQSPQTPAPTPQLSDFCLTSISVTDTSDAFNGDYLLLNDLMNGDQHFATYDSSGLQFGYFPLSFDCSTKSAAPGNSGYGFALYDSSTCQFLYLDDAISTIPPSQDTSLVLCNALYSGIYEFAGDRMVTLCLDPCDQCICTEPTCSINDNEEDCVSSCLGDCQWFDGIDGLTGYEDGFCRPPCNVPVDLIFVIDESGSVADNFADEINFAVDIITTGTSPDSHFGVIFFSHEVENIPQTLNDANQDPSNVASILQGYGATFGGTRIYLGVEAAIDMFNTHDNTPGSGGNTRDNVMVLITDGQGGNPCDGGSLQNQIVTDLMNNNVATVAIGIDGVNSAQLNCLTSAPLDGVPVSLENWEDLLYEIRQYTDPFTCPDE